MGDHKTRGVSPDRKIYLLKTFPRRFTEREDEMRTDVQKLTLPCPVNGNLAKVEVRCEVRDHGVEAGKERRILKEILTCTFGRPGLACHPACEAEIRRLVEY